MAEKERESILAQFCSISAMSTEDAMMYLSMHDWNLEESVNSFLIAGPPSSSSAAPSEVEVRAPIPSVVAKLTDESIFEYEARMNRRNNRAPKREANAFDANADFQMYQPPAQAAPNDGPPSKVPKLAKLFRLPLDVVFQGTLDEAMAHTRELKRPLLVILHKADLFECHALMRDALVPDESVRVLRTYYTVYIVNANDGNADYLRFQAFYVAPELPYVAVFHPTTGENVTNLSGAECTADAVKRLLEQCRLVDTLEVMARSKHTAAVRAVALAADEEEDQVPDDSLLDLLDQEDEDEEDAPPTEMETKCAAMLVKYVDAGLREGGARVKVVVDRAKVTDVPSGDGVTVSANAVSAVLRVDPNEPMWSLMSQAANALNVPLKPSATLTEQRSKRSFGVGDAEQSIGECQVAGARLLFDW